RPDRGSNCGATLRLRRLSGFGAGGSAIASTARTSERRHGPHAVHRTSLEFSPIRCAQKPLGSARVSRADASPARTQRVLAIADFLSYTFSGTRVGIEEKIYTTRCRNKTAG